MPDPTALPRLVRFGAFEVDLRAGELRKNGLKIKLQEQPFQILVMLLARPGEVVTREEIQQKLWPEDTFVDFEHGINAAINRLREALSDSVDQPRYVETLHRRGYRFIFPVAPVGSVAAGLARHMEHGGVKPPLRRWLVALGAGLGVIMLALAAYWLTGPLPPPRLTNAVRIARLRGGTWNGPLLTDGNRIYFTDYLGDSAVIMQVSVTGGEGVQIPTPFRYAATQDISLKRSELLISGGDSMGVDMPLWALPLVGGSPRRVGDIAGGASWFPDGERILFNKGSDFYVAKSNGTESRKLSTAPGPLTPYFISPDGRVIRFGWLDAQGGFLWEVDADGGNLHRLLPGWSRPGESECCGMWTPDGKYFIFSALRENKEQALWALREETALFSKSRRDPVQLTRGPINYIMASPSLDGKKLFAIGRLYRGQLVRYEARAREYLPYLGGISASDVDFSRDGQRIAYVVWPEGTVWQSKIDGSEQLQLTFPPLAAMLPRRSPDGKRIAFMGQSRGKPWKIYLISADGGAPQLLIPGDREEADPQWSPDGNQLLFGRWPADPLAPIALHLLDLRTNQVSTVPRSEGLWSPRWSRDGRYVVAMKEGARKLVLFDFTTHRQVELATSKDPGFGWPNWSHDGKSVHLWGVPAEGKAGIYRIRLSDRKLQLIASDKEVGRIYGASGPWVGLAPDDSPLVMRDISLTEIYAFDWEAP